MTLTGRDLQMIGVRIFLVTRGLGAPGNGVLVSTISRTATGAQCEAQECTGQGRTLQDRPSVTRIGPRMPFEFALHREP